MQMTRTQAATQENMPQQALPQTVAEKILPAIKQMQNDLKQQLVYTRQIKSLESKLTAVEIAVAVSGAHRFSRVVLLCCNWQARKMT